MTKKMTVSIADRVFADIEELKKPNRSEFVEELLRIGLREIKKEK